MSASVSTRRSASSGEPACTVDSEPSWPLDIAASMSSASGPRTSPTMIRSGRMRSALRTSRRTVTSPRPSSDAGRASRRTTCACCRRSSAASSTVTIRSPSGMNDDSALSVVVLPEPVPPLTRTFSRARTAAREQLAQRRRPRPDRDEVVRREARATEAADREHRPVDRERRDDDVDPRAVRQPRVHERLGLVDAPAERREDPLDRVAQIGLRVERDAGVLDPAGPLDEDRARAVDHDLVDGRVAQQRLERAEPEGPLDDAAHEVLARLGVEHPGLALDERADAGVEITVLPGARLAYEPLAQRGGKTFQFVAHTTGRPPGGDVRPPDGLTAAEAGVRAEIRRWVSAGARSGGSAARVHSDRPLVSASGSSMVDSGPMGRPGRSSGSPGG